MMDHKEVFRISLLLMRFFWPSFALILAASLFSCALASVPPLPPGISDASVPGDSDRIFNDASLHQFDLSVDPEIFKRVLLEHEPYGEVSPYRLVASVSLDGVSMGNVAIRGRGNSFEETSRRSFKLKFDCIDPLIDAAPESAASQAYCPDYAKRKFMGLVALNLRCSNNDPSLVREILAYQLFRKAGVPAPRASLALLRVNGQALGVYSLVEELDKAFLENWFEDDGGNLYKCSWSGRTGANFEAGSYSEIRYQRESGDRDGAFDVRRLIDGLSSVSSGPDLGALMDKENLLAYNALVSLTGHWDSLNGNVNNDYIYRDRLSGRWYVIVWDTDNSFGSDWIPGLDTLSSPLDVIALSTQSSSRFCRLAATFWRPEYRLLLEKILEEQGNGSAFAAEAYRLRDQIKDAVRDNDPLLLSYESFLESFDDRPENPPFHGSEIPQYRDGVGLTSFFRQRLTFMAERLETY